MRVNQTACHSIFLINPVPCKYGDSIIDINTEIDTFYLKKNLVKINNTQKLKVMFPFMIERK